MPGSLTAEVMGRVVEIWVPDDPADDTADSASTDGTGYLVAPRAVLTACHVVEAALSERPRDSAAASPLRVRPLGKRGAKRQGPWLAARVAWHNKALDVALVEVREGETGVMEAAPWAEVEGNVAVLAVGFPVIEHGPDLVHDTEQVEGKVNFGSRWKRNQLVVDIESGVASLPEGSDAETPWEGMSGAALLTDQQVIGVIIQERRPYRGRRLLATPAARIVEAEGFRDAAAELHFHPELGYVGGPSRGQLEPSAAEALYRLHDEDDPIIADSKLRALCDANSLMAVIDELLHINRRMWRHLVKAFENTCDEPEESPLHRDLRPYLEKLEKNRSWTSDLLQRGSFEGLNFSDTFYPNLQAPAVTFTNCNFSSSLLHYSNLHGAEFNDCDLFSCILIGSYLEKAKIPPRRRRIKQNVVDYTARYHSKGDRDLSSTPPSFMLEVEQGWRGHWTEQADQIRTAKRVFKAVWPDPSNKTKKKVRATIVLGENGRFERTASTDKNNGTYETISSNRWLMLDSGIVLIGGTRTLVRGASRPWWAIWWQQLSH